MHETQMWLLPLFYNIYEYYRSVITIWQVRLWFIMQKDLKTGRKKCKLFKINKQTNEQKIGTWRKMLDASWKKR